MRLVGSGLARIVQTQPFAIPPSDNIAATLGQNLLQSTLQPLSFPIEKESVVQGASYECTIVVSGSSPGVDVWVCRVYSTMKTRAASAEGTFGLLDRDRSRRR